MKIKRMYKIASVMFTTEFKPDGTDTCVLTIEWIPTKRNKLGDAYAITYIVKSMDDAQHYVNRIKVRE